MYVCGVYVYVHVHVYDVCVCVCCACVRACTLAGTTKEMKAVPSDACAYHKPLEILDWIDSQPTPPRVWACVDDVDLPTLVGASCPDSAHRFDGHFCRTQVLSGLTEAKADELARLLQR